MFTGFLQARIEALPRSAPPMWVKAIVVMVVMTLAGCSADDATDDAGTPVLMPSANSVPEQANTSDLPPTAVLGANVTSLDIAAGGNA